VPAHKVQQEKNVLRILGFGQKGQQLFWRDRIVVTKPNRTCCAVDVRVFLKPTMDANREVADNLLDFPPCENRHDELLDTGNDGLAFHKRGETLYSGPQIHEAQPVIDRGKRHAVEFERGSNRGLLPTVESGSGFIGER
jgi:hypothetical protein